MPSFRLASSFFSLLLLPGLAIAQLPLDTNLLQNPDFETDVSGWTVTRGSFTIRQYGSTVAPTLVVGATINGGTGFVDCYAGISNGNEYTGSMEQTIDVSSNAAQIDGGSVFVALSGSFGGPSGTNARSYLRARYFNGSGGELTVPFTNTWLPALDGTNRNGQSTLLRVRREFPVPAATRSIKIEFHALNGYGNGGSYGGWADKLDVRLLAGPTIQTQPMNTNLLDMSSFEGASLVHPDVTNGAIVTIGGFRQASYGTATAPSAGVAASMGGGTAFVELWTGAWNGNETYGRMQNEIDVSGNAADIDMGALFLEMSGHFGGPGSVDARTWLKATFLNATGGEVSVPFIDSTLPVLGRVSRNSESTLLLESSSFPIPPLTRSVKVELFAYGGYGNNSSNLGWADNLSAKLIYAVNRYTPQVGTNLIDNGTFESGAVLNPPAARGWRVQRGTFQAQPYGLPNLPTPAVASSIGGGTFLVRPLSVSSGLATMTQSFELNNLETMVDTSQLSIRLEGHLGGIGSAADNCYVRTLYYSQFGAQLGVDQIGPVTAPERSLQSTLLYRQGTFLLPVGTRKLVVEANFAGANALLDNLRATLVPSGVALLYPGTGDDLTLGTGVNGQPSGGPGRDLKFALANDILSVEMRSPLSSFHWKPLLLAGNAQPTGSSVPSLGLPALHVNPFAPNFFFLLDGATPMGPFAPGVVLPTGTQLQLAVPPGLNGFSVLLQAIVLDGAAGNGIYATSDAHEVRFQ